MIIAGAGSGKTRMITYRIAYMLSKGIDQSEILALTFTNKAAKEMADRVRETVGKKLDKLTTTTFLWAWITQKLYTISGIQK